ncbi:uncharacterized protein LOC136768408 [Amia ocellicauda]|uniref:uncharacterized protein LOC136768408 n=1 Tax=Amia ocellicauda TaxID=2972642 RepID=UPI0034646C0A
MSSANKREWEQKRRLQQFLGDLALLGSLQGFRYFQPWLRGREELLLTVVNEDLGWRSPGVPGSEASSLSSSSSSSSEGAEGQAWGEEQMLLSNRISEGYLLPASPSDREIAVPEMSCTLFLLAGYAKYGRPYAWIRSNHERLVSIGGTDSLVRDTPLKLRSISDWTAQGNLGTSVWDIMSELVALCTSPPPINPFSVDLRFLGRLPLPERFLVSGALVHFLEKVAVYGNPEEPYYNKVVEDLDALRRLHVRALWDVQRTGPGHPNREEPEDGGGDGDGADEPRTS